jgi:hypothetical protein
LNLSSIAIIALLAVGCGGSQPAAATPAPAPEPESPKACQEAYDDLSKYFDADPERKRPAGFRADSFLPACRELPPAAQRCLLFSYMQAHAARCDEVNRSVDPALLHKIAEMAGK